MSNKKKSIQEANLLLEKRFLNESKDLYSSKDKDGNLWYVAKLKNNKYKIAFQYKKYINDKYKPGIDPLSLKNSDSNLWKKISNLEKYFVEYNNSDQIKPYIDTIINTISGVDKGTSGGSGTYVTQDDLNKIIASKLPKIS